MARHPFGQTTADYVVAAGADNALMFGPGADLTSWNMKDGGTQYADITEDRDGTTPVNTWLSGDGATGPAGLPATVYGPDNVLWWWVSADGGPRVLMLCSDLAEVVASLGTDQQLLADQLQDFIDSSQSPATYKDKTWAAVGTSITHMGFYTDAMATALNCTVVNLGVSGGTICTGTASDGTSVGNGDTFEQLANIPAGTPLVTLEAGVNDFRASMPLGQMGDTDQSTFYGALYAAITAIKASSPSADIALFTPYGFTDHTFSGTWNTPNGFGKSLADFQKAVRDVAGQFGVPAILIGEESGIGGPTAGYYLSDGLHLNDAGGQRFADYAVPRLLAAHVNWDYPSDGDGGPTYGPTLNANSDFEVDVSKWYATHSATLASSTAFAHAGTKSMEITPNGSTAAPGAASWSVPITGGHSYRVSGWIYAPAGWSQASISANWLDDSDAYVSGADKGWDVLPAATWRQFAHTFTADAAATRAAITVGLNGTPAATDVFYLDDVTIQEVLTG